MLILVLIGAVAYLAYDDYYRQRPALQQARAEIQQLRQNSGHLAVTPGSQAPAPRGWAPITPTPPAWFQKHLEEGPALEQSRQHRRQGEVPSTPRP
jgi:hypothetical protein